MNGQRPTTSLLHLVPVMLTLFIAFILSLLLYLSRLSLPQPVITPAPEPPAEAPPEQALTNVSPYINALIVVGLIFVGSFILITIVSRYRILLRIFIFSILSIIAFSTTLFFLEISPLFSSSYNVIASLLITLAILLVVYREIELASVVGLSYVAAAAGTILGFSIPFWTTIVLVLLISAYDIYAIFRGHLRALGSEDSHSLQGLMVDFRGISIGLGDLFFYSILLAFVIANFSIVSGIMTSLGILIGFYLTLQLLKKWRAVPGLPISLILGLALAYVSLAI